MNIKKIRDNGFTAIDNEIVRDKELSLKAKGLFLTMWSLPDNWSFSINGLQHICKENDHAISSGLAELEKYGYLIRDYFYNEKGHKQANYTLLENPTKANPTKENPTKENPTKENQGNNKRKKEINKEIIKERNNISSSKREREELPSEVNPHKNGLISKEEKEPAVKRNWTY